jgi:hypothetical protein
MRVLLLLFAQVSLLSCASSGPRSVGPHGLANLNRADQLQLSFTVAQAAANSAERLARYVSGRTVSLHVQPGARAGVALLANLLEGELVQAGAVGVVRGSGAELHLRMLVRALGAERVADGDGFQVTTFIEGDLRLLTPKGEALIRVPLRGVRSERVKPDGTREDAQAGAAKPVPRLDLPPEPRRARAQRPAARQTAKKRGKKRRADEAAEGRRKRERKAAAEAERAADRRRAKKEEGAAASRRAAAAAQAEAAAAAERSAKASRRPARASAQVEAGGGRRARRRVEPVTHPQLDHKTLCKPTEQVIFSCRARAKQGLALCASPDFAFDTGTLRYRFGRGSKVLRELPAGDAGGQDFFTYKSERDDQGDKVQEVSFKDGGKTYTLWSREVDVFTSEQSNAAGMTIRKPSGSAKKFDCVTEHHDAMGQLRDHLAQ